MVTGVFAALRVKRRTTPPGMFTVVKLKTPVAGSVSVRFVDGLSAPSAPVLPLLNWACAGCDASTTLATASGIEVRITRSSSRDREDVAAGARSGRRAVRCHDAYHPGAGGRAGGDRHVGDHPDSVGPHAEVRRRHRGVGGVVTKERQRRGAGQPAPRDGQGGHGPRYAAERCHSADDRLDGDARRCRDDARRVRSEEHTSELQSLAYLVCRLLLEKKKKKKKTEKDRKTM